MPFDFKSSSLPFTIPPSFRLSISGVTLDKSTSSNLTSIVVDNESKAFALKIIFSKLLVILIGSSLNPFVLESYTKVFFELYLVLNSHITFLY